MKTGIYNQNGNWLNQKPEIKIETTIYNFGFKSWFGSQTRIEWAPSENEKTALYHKKRPQHFDQTTYLFTKNSIDTLNGMMEQT